MPKRILVVDVGGTNVKVHLSGEEESLKIPSGRLLTPRRMIAKVLSATRGRSWAFDAVTIGVPAPVVAGKVALEPANLGRGWTRFDFARAMGRPVRMVNDAAMQALGSYRGRGTMLFLGLGTGLGSSLVADGAVVPLELARLPYRQGELEDYLGERALRRLGKARWRERVSETLTVLRAAFIADEVVIGGGNARRLKSWPGWARPGSNALAMLGGERLWEERPRAPARGAIAPAGRSRALRSRRPRPRSGSSARRRPTD
ncbi:MAG TPA: ROK family protein [Anaeromyxobacteraceae bacterium]|nr:ROK family protein [Anaeromyxobacteraceae bacterium]